MKGELKKEVRNVVKYIAAYFENVDWKFGGKHLRLKIQARNDCGELVDLPLFIMSTTPSSASFRVKTLAQLRRIMRDHRVPVTNF